MWLGEGKTECGSCVCTLVQLGVEEDEVGRVRVATARRFADLALQVLQLLLGALKTQRNDLHDCSVKLVYDLCIKFTRFILKNIK